MIRIIFVLILFACSSPKAITSFGGVAMTVPYRILVAKDLSFFEKKNLEKLIESTFHEVDRIYNDWNPYSEISQLNALQKGVKKRLSPKLEHFLNLTDQMVRLTEGRFDPTVRPLQKLWRSKLEQGKIPDNEEIAQLMPAIGWNNIHIKEGFFWKDHDATSLDLGGIAKGYAVDLLVERLMNAGFADLYVEWGGEIRVNGKHPENRPWKVFITRMGDINPDHAIAIVTLSNEAIATSGDYLQYWTIGNEKFFHIINPRTGQPLQSTTSSIASASVQAPTCTLADALATALMMPDNNKDWFQGIVREHPSVKYWIEVN